MKLRWKLFSIILGTVGFILLGILVVNSVYLERFFVREQKEKLLEIGRVLTDPAYVVDLQNIEMHSNVSISIKKLEMLNQFEKSSMMSRSEIDDISGLLKQGKMIFSEVRFLDYRGKSLILFIPYREDMYFEILSPLNFLEEGAGASTKYNVRLVVVIFIFGCLASFVFAKKISQPLVELKNIANNISRSDFSQKFEYGSRDEVGQLGISINKMAEELENNITEINNKNLMLEKEVEHEKRLEKMRKEFIANVSHELKTPIAIIQGYAQGLAEGVVAAEDMDFYTSTIMEESVKMNNLVQELLLVSKMESSRMEFNRRHMDYYPTIQDFIRKFSRDNKKIYYAGPGEIRVVCDDKFIDRVMNNFIVNALKYSTENSDIGIEVTEEAEDFKIAVKNETDRLNPEDLGDIWIPFYRKDAARDRDGHGLGLSIVKGILENHKCPYGTEMKDKVVSFWFKLPKAVEPPDDEDDDEFDEGEDA
ncbi:MAG: HAMP domain-containing histidine kinase [Fusobacteriaceae bacterium]|jgi:signal transduction histidine kinase|nr:HAMP domain-containing histidine kinase [Fusobacteriaceae bacterium]